MVPELMFDEPRPGRPPRHLADLDAAGRASAVAELGLPAFRAKQLAHQYYGRLIADPRQMTDLPAAFATGSPERCSRTCLPRPPTSPAMPARLERRCGGPSTVPCSNRC